MGVILSPESVGDQDHSAVTVSDADADATAKQPANKRNKVSPEQKPVSHLQSNILLYLLPMSSHIIMVAYYQFSPDTKAYLSSGVIDMTGFFYRVI